MTPPRKPAKAVTPQAADLRKLAEDRARDTEPEQPVIPAVLSPEQMRKMLHELKVHQIEIEVQNEELRRAQREIDTVRARYFDLFDLAPMGYCTITEKGSIVESNLAVATMLDVARSSLVNQPFFRFVYDPDMDIYITHRRKTVESGEPQACELRMVKQDGTVFWVHLEATVTEDDKGTPVCRIALVDVTARRQAEANLQESESRLGCLIAGLPNSIVYQMDVEPDGRRHFAFISAGVRHIHGVTEEDVLRDPMTLYNQCVQEDRTRLAEAEDQAEKNNAVFTIEIRMRSPGGDVRWVLLRSAPRRLSGGTIRWDGIEIDITESKRAAEAQNEIESRSREQAALLHAYRESATNFHAFFEAMTDMIMVGTPDGRILFTNTAVMRTLGYSAEELNTLHVLDLHPADKRREAEAIFAAMFKGERECCPLPLARKDGTLVPVETRVWFGRWDGAECIFGISKNLTAEQEAQQRFERLFRNNPSLMALSNLPDRRFIDVNDSFLKVLGYSRSEIIGKTTNELGLIPHQGHLAALADKLQADGRIVDLELQVRRKDGAILDGLFSGELIDSQGHQYFLTVMTDITERKRNELDLARFSVMQRELVHLATDFVNVPLEQQEAAIDQSLAIMGKLIHADRAYLFAYDFNAGIIVNTHEWCGIGIAPEIGNLQAVPTAMVPEWVDTHRRGKPLHIPSVAALPEGSNLRHVLEPQGIRSLITMPLMRGAACLGFVGFDAVREERVWQEGEISLLRVLAELYTHFEARRASDRNTRDLQKRLDQARDTFIHMLVHDMRSPLHAIIGHLQAIEESGDRCLDPDNLGSLRDAIRGAQLLSRMVSTMVDLNRMETEKIPMRLQAVPVNDIFHAARAQVLNPANIRRVAECIAEPCPLILCDIDLSVRIVANLLSNALKYSPGDSGIDISATPDPGGVIIRVRDRGPGIPAQYHQRIFEKFGVADQSSGARTASTGLGLAFCKLAVEAQGGAIGVESKPGNGSTFWFILPATTSVTRNK